MAGSCTAVLHSKVGRSCAVFAVLLGAILSGCTDEAARPEPLPSPSSSPSPSPAASASPAAPSLPAAARGTSAASAEAFARHYVHVINAAMTSGDTALMRRDASRRCSGCRLLADEIDDLYLAGGRIEGGGWVSGERSRLVAAGNAVRMRLAVRITEQTVYAESGAQPTISRSEDGHLRFVLTRRSNAWSVAQMDALR